MSDSTDFVVSLPTDTGIFTAASMLPAGLLDTNHVLLLADDVVSDEVEALALPQDIQPGWAGVSNLQLFPGVSLSGPWKVDAEMRGLLGAPGWITQLVTLDRSRIHADTLPAELVGLDPLSDAFPHTQPTGVELVALTRLQTITRRLVEALRPTPGGNNEDPVLVEPSPKVSTSSTVYAPVWLGLEDLVAALQPVVPGVSTVSEAIQPRGAVGLDAIDPEQLESLAERIGPDVLEKAWHGSGKVHQDTMRQEIVAAVTGNVIEEVRDGYVVVTPVDPEHEGWGRIEVRTGAADGLPLAVRSKPWARGAVLSYDLCWIPQDQTDAYAGVVSYSRCRERQTARDLVEELATALVTAVPGVAVDNDGSLVSLGRDVAEA